jgi:hypothetical protein
MPDIETRDDCERLVRAFYGRALADPIIGFIFTDVARLDLEAHVPEITSFWETVLPDLAGEADLEAHLLADVHAQFLGDALGHRACRQPAWLGVADQPVVAQAKFEAHLGDLGGLTGTGLAGDDGDLVRRDGCHQVFAPFGDRQLGGIGDVKCHVC